MSIAKPLSQCPTCSQSIEDADLGLRDYTYLFNCLPGKVGPMDGDLILRSRTGKKLLLVSSNLASRPLSRSDSTGR